MCAWGRYVGEGRDEQAMDGCVLLFSPPSSSSSASRPSDAANAARALSRNAQYSSATPLKRCSGGPPSHSSLGDLPFAPFCPRGRRRLCEITVLATLSVSPPPLHHGYGVVTVPLYRVSLKPNRLRSRWPLARGVSCDPTTAGPRLRAWTRAGPLTPLRSRVAETPTHCGRNRWRKRG